MSHQTIQIEHLRTNLERYLIKLLLSSQTAILHQSEGKKSVHVLGNHDCHRWKVLELNDNKHSRDWITEHFLSASSFLSPWVYISSSDTATPALLWPSHEEEVLGGVSSLPLATHFLKHPASLSLCTSYEFQFSKRTPCCDSVTDFLSGSIHGGDYEQ